MSILWQCPKCERDKREQTSCEFCEHWDDIPDFSAPFEHQSQDQAALHDVKGSKINRWPKIPITVIQAHRERWYRDLRKKTGTILEIGCHRSGVLHTFHEKGWTVCGIDVSRQSIVDQNQLISGHFAVAPAEWIPLESSSIDAVLAIHVLEHVDDLQQALNEIKRVLKPGGVCFIEIPVKNFGISWEAMRFMRDREQWKREAASAGHLWDKLPQSHHFFDLLESTGLHIIKKERGWVWFGPFFNWSLLLLNKMRRQALLKKQQPMDNGQQKQTSEEKNRQMNLHNEPHPSLLRRTLSTMVRSIDLIEHTWLPNSKHGGTQLILCQKQEEVSG